MIDDQFLTRAGADAEGVHHEDDLPDVGMPEAFLLQALSANMVADPCPLDVTDRDATRSAVDAAISRYGRLDVFVANAGVMPLSRLDAGLVDQWNHMIDVNVRGLLHGIDSVLPHFTERGSGHFITTASVGAHQVTATAAVYCATNYAAWAVTEGLRLESPAGIRVTTVSPGVVVSELASTITDPHAQGAMEHYRRNAIPATAVADAVAYAMAQPAEVDVNEIIVRPALQR